MPSFSHGFSLIDGDGQQRGGLLFCRQAKCASHKRGPELPRTTVMGRIVWPRGPNNPIRPKLPAKPPASPTTTVAAAASFPNPFSRLHPSSSVPAGHASLFLTPAEPGRGRRLPLSAAPGKNGFPLQQIPGGMRPCLCPFTCRNHRGISICLIRPGRWR